MTYFLQGFGVFLGVIAGTAVTLLTQWWMQRRTEKQQTENLKFELKLNIAKIEAWILELEGFRNAVNGDALHEWFGYFNLSRTISPTANSMFLSGLLYKKLTRERIGDLQGVLAELSLTGEQYMNARLGESRQAFIGCREAGNMAAWTTNFKPDAVGSANFWQRKLTEHRDKLQTIVASL